MSAKRQATTELNHENWNEEDPADHEEMGTFKTAPKEILEKRVIKTAKRRTLTPSDETKKGGVFSGFGGFNKAAPSSFDFLANLTNGNKSNGSSVGSNDSTSASSVFGNKASALSLPNAKSTFGTPTTQTSSLFGSPSTPAATLFSAKGETKSESPFKIIASSSSDTMQVDKNEAKVSTTMFSGVLSSNTNKSPFTSSSSTPFKMQATTGSTMSSSFGSTSTTEKEQKNDDNKLKYYSKLKGLNESVSDWIKKHVEETPLCILTPIFKDYEKYLKEIQEEYEGSKETNRKQNEKNMKESKIPTESKTEDNKTNLDNTLKSTSGSPGNTSASTLFAKTNTPSKTSLFGSKNSEDAGKSSGFSFGNTFATNTTNTTSGATSGFSFGINSAQPSQTPAPSIFSASSNTTNNGSTPFSFGTGKPFSFNTNNVKPNTEQPTENNEEEEEPPKVEFTPVVEENSVFDKKCKVFVKKDGNFVDKGVGTLYIKKIEDSGKYQLLVRANTSLGNVLLNLILSASIPTQRLGKNNVMMACIPTPESKPPPTPVLIRVKTSDEADDLLETINKYKM